MEAEQAAAYASLAKGQISRSGSCLVNVADKHSLNSTALAAIREELEFTFDEGAYRQMTRDIRSDQINRFNKLAQAVRAQMARSGRTGQT